MKKDRKEPKKRYREYEGIFGKGDNYNIEISHHPDIENHANIQKGLVELVKKQTFRWRVLKISII